jgi:transcriptional regulator with XRE-family HTH domain
MGMFANLGRTLSLLRELRGKSQTRVAKEARIGKSQLSKYENGKELPKLDSLEKILRVLKVDMFEFFYTLYLLDGRAASLAAADPASAATAPPPGAPGHTPASGAAAGAAVNPAPQPGPLYLLPMPHEHPLLAPATDEAFARVFADLLLLYRRIFEQVVLSGAGSSGNLKA